MPARYLAADCGPAGPFWHVAARSIKYFDIDFFGILTPVATTIHVTEATRDHVNQLGERTSQTTDEVVVQALREYERALFWEQYARAAEADARDGGAAADNVPWDQATTEDAVAGDS